MKNILRIYKDKELTQEIVSVFDLGIVPAGTIKSFTFWVLNDSSAKLKTLKFSIEHQEVKITKSPEELEAHENSQLVLSWSPSVTLKEGLKARLRISGIELWG